MKQAVIISKTGKDARVTIELRSGRKGKGRLLKSQMVISDYGLAFAVINMVNFAYYNGYRVRTEIERHFFDDSVPF